MPPITLTLWTNDNRIRAPTRNTWKRFCTTAAVIPGRSTRHAPNCGTGGKAGWLSCPSFYLLSKCRHLFQHTCFVVHFTMSDQGASAPMDKCKALGPNLVLMYVHEALPMPLQSDESCGVKPVFPEHHYRKRHAWGTSSLPPCTFFARFQHCAQVWHRRRRIPAL